MAAIELLETLEDLGDKELKTFKWYLQQPDFLRGVPSIPKSRLEKADRPDTVDMMVETYSHQFVEVATRVLKRMRRNDLVRRLSIVSSGPEGGGVGAAPGTVEAADNEADDDDGEESPSVGPQIAPPPDLSEEEAADEDDDEDDDDGGGEYSSVGPQIAPPPDLSEDLMVSVSRPPQPNTLLQLAVQADLQSMFKGAQGGWMETPSGGLLCDINLELLVTDGLEKVQHQLRKMQMQSGEPAESQRPIQPSNIFQHPSIRTVLTSGIAGIGKTFLVQKFLLDWAEKRTSQDLHLIFLFTVQQLNLWKEERFRLAELIHTCIPETKCINEETLNDIFTTVQKSSFDTSDFKLLFVFDGLDESHLQLDLRTNKTVNVTKPTRVDVLLTNLIRGKLLPSARLWITTRPAAAIQIPPQCVDMVTEVRGFTDPQKEEYFRKRFRDEEQARKIISHIKRSRSLHIMCHIPVFCWITATVLEELLKTKERGELPKTLTEMYIHFLVVQINKAKEKYISEKCLQYIQCLAKLAFHQLLKSSMIFREEDLTHSGINTRAASKYSGLFTQIFTQVCGKREDDQINVFCFSHLSVHEFLAAVHVNISLFNYNKNVMSGRRLKVRSLLTCFNNTSTTNVHKTAVKKALQSPSGHLDLFLRFLLGLSLPNNQTLVSSILTLTGGRYYSNQNTVQYIKKKMRNSSSPERTILLFHCLNELNDRSLVEEIQQSFRSGCLSTDKLSPAQWSALVFILLSSEEDLDVFDLKKYSASEEALLRLLPVVKASNKALLSNCNLSERSCEALSSVLSSQSSSLRHLDLSNNNLQDLGVKLLSGGLKSPHCRLETLSLSGCLITEEGCASLASALTSNPSHLKELDLSYNHPGASGVKLLSAGLEDPGWRLDSLRLDFGGEQMLKPGLQKYACELELDMNTVHENLIVSSNNRKVRTTLEEQLYPQHPDRFDIWLQVLCRHHLTGRCYWEVKWRGLVNIAVTYGDISRRGDSLDCAFGQNDQSWTLRCNGHLHRYSVWHNKSQMFSSSFSSSSSSYRVAVYVDCPAGSLSFYRVSSDSLIHIYTFNTTFTDPLYAGFGFEFDFHDFGLMSSVSLRHL